MNSKNRLLSSHNLTDSHKTYVRGWYDADGTAYKCHAVLRDKHHLKFTYQAIKGYYQKFRDEISVKDKKN